MRGSTREAVERRCSVARSLARRRETPAAAEGESSREVSRRGLSVMQKSG